MKIITRSLLARDVYNHWVKCYGNGKEDIAIKLKNLGNTPDPDKVDKIIGNGSWTRLPMCSECGEHDKPFIIQLGEEPDIESDTVWLCGECVNTAYKKIKYFKKQLKEEE